MFFHVLSYCLLSNEMRLDFWISNSSSRLITQSSFFLKTFQRPIVSIFYCFTLLFKIIIVVSIFLVINYVFLQCRQCLDLCAEEHQDMSRISSKFMDSKLKFRFARRRNQENGSLYFLNKHLSISFFILLIHFVFWFFPFTV